MKKILTTDVWTEPFTNHYICFNGAFVDGIEKDKMPYDSYKIILNCNCEITTNTEDLIIGNKHHAIVFYKNNNIVRLAVIDKDTAVLNCVENALNQKIENITLKDLLNIKGVKHTVIDLKENPKLNQHNNKVEIDVGSCDRLNLLQSMLEGDYTESETSYGNYDNNIYDFLPDVKIDYNLKTDNEIFEISHKGAYINKTKTRIIIIQSNSSLAKENLNNI